MNKRKQPAEEDLHQLITVATAKLSHAHMLDVLRGRSLHTSNEQTNLGDQPIKMSQKSL